MSSPEMLPLETDVQTLSELRAAGADFLLLDVREVPEFETCRIEGATLIPMSELGERLAELEPHRSQHIVVHCHHGGRSMRVTQYLRDQGFAQAQNLAGGIDAWSIHIDPEVPRY
jgi:rhodanese-related sulfurtransferase